MPDSKSDPPHFVVHTTRSVVQETAGLFIESFQPQPVAALQRKNWRCKTQKDPAENGRVFFIEFVSQGIGRLLNVRQNTQYKLQPKTTRQVSPHMPALRLLGFTCVYALPGQRLRAAMLLRLQSGELPQSLRRNSLFGWCRLRQQAASQLSRLCAPAG